MLKDDNKRVLFYTNGGYCSRHFNYQQVDSWLQRELSADQYSEIKSKVSLQTCYNTAFLMGRYLTEKLPDKSSKILTVGNTGLNDEIKAAGFPNAELLTDPLVGMTEQEFEAFSPNPNVKAIVMSVCDDFNFRKVAIASYYLSDPEVVFGATNEDHTWVCGKSLRHMPDVGATLRAIEASCGR